MACPPAPASRAGRCLDAVARQARPECRHEHRANAVAAPRHRIGLRMDEQRIADVVPGEGDVLAPRHRPFGPEIARIAGFAELGIGDGNASCPTALR